MSNITKAAQDALAELADWHWSQAATLRKAACTSAMDKPEPVQSSLTRMADWHDAQKSLIRAALQDKAGEVQGYEPAGFLLHWPAPGGGRDILWSKDGAAGHAIGCPVTEIFKATDRAAQPAPVVPDGFALVPVEANDEILRPFRYCPDDQLFLAWRVSIRIAAAQQKGGQ